MTKNNYTLAISLGFIAYFFYAIMDVVIKFSRNFYQDISFSVFYFYINWLICIFLLTFGVLIYKQKFFIIKNKLFVLIRSVVNVMVSILAFITLPLVPLDIYYAIIFTTPIIADLIAVFFLKERFSRYRILVAVLGFIGVLLITNPFAILNKPIIPIVLALGIALLDACSVVITRKYLQKENAFSIAFFTFFLGGCLSIFILLFSQTKLFMVSSNVFGIFMIIAFCNCCALIAFIKAYQTAQVQIVSPTEYSLMLFGIFFGYLVFNELPTLITLVGSLIIIASSSYLVLNSKKLK